MTQSLCCCDCIADSFTFTGMSGKGLEIGTINNFTIQNSIFQLIKNDAIGIKTGSNPSNIKIINCTFIHNQGSAIYVQNITDSFIFSNNYIYNVSYDNAITLRSTGFTDNIEITNNHIEHIYGNGILSGENHLNLNIKNNYIYDVGLDNQSWTTGAPHHGMYIQGKNFTITNNIVHLVHNPNGNC